MPVSVSPGEHIEPKIFEDLVASMPMPNRIKSVYNMRDYIITE